VSQLAETPSGHTFSSPNGRSKSRAAAARQLIVAAGGSTRTSGVEPAPFNRVLNAPPTVVADSD
jgi:hypothetical protein